MADEQEASGSIPTDVPQPPPVKGEVAEGKHEDEDMPSLNALNLTWSFGMNKNVPVLNMTDETRSHIAYPCSHTLVLYDYEHNQQMLLQGHSNAITCTCTSGDKRWLASGDKGEDSTVIIWDTKHGTPVRTMFEPHENGVIAMAMTNDAKYLALLSAADTQILSIWDWTVEGETPMCTATLDPSFGVQNYIHFNPQDPNQLITNSESQVIFYKWAPEQELVYRTPPLSDDDFNKQVGRYSQSIYMHNSTRALTATSVGNLVVWDNNMPLNKGEDAAASSKSAAATNKKSLAATSKSVAATVKEGEQEIKEGEEDNKEEIVKKKKKKKKPEPVPSKEPSPDKKAQKLVKLQERGLTVLTTVDDFIVIGDLNGHVKFFDQNMKLVHWYQDFCLGPINALSFAHMPGFNKANKLQISKMSNEESENDSSSTINSHEGDYPLDSTIGARKFVLRDFVVGTSSAVFAHVQTNGTDVSVIHRDHDSSVHALSAHPFENRIVVASYSGLIKVWDYETKKTLVSRVFERGSIRCCSYNPSAEYIAVGFMNGAVRVLDALTLYDVLREPFRYARDAITHVAFSHDSVFLACADVREGLTLFQHKTFERAPIGIPILIEGSQVQDAENTTALYAEARILGGSAVGSGSDVYVYVGRYRAHYKFIVDIMFGTYLDTEKPRLLSLGEDRFLVEYDLENSRPEVGLKVLSSERLEQSAIPLCSAWYPPVTKESFILTANDQFKFKLYNTTTKMCRKTLLAPTYGSPMQKLVVLPTKDEVNDKRYLAYITVDKVGLHSLPLDGNPHNAIALIAHPQGVANLVSSYDGKYIFTAGGDDSTVHMWTINTQALEAQSKLGGEDLIPFYGLLDGGRDGPLFKELEDYFYYAQIRSQGVNTTDSRTISTKIPLSEVPFVMRAMGFYPSEQEIDEMLNEVKYSRYVETGKYIEDIDLGDFIKLYINHRPAFGLEPQKLMWAFEVLGFENDIGDIIVERGDMLDVLQSKGEHMTEMELAEYLTTLLGFNPEGGSSEEQEFDPSTAGTIIDENLPHEISAEMFANQLLGLGMQEELLTPQMSKQSLAQEQQA